LGSGLSSDQLVIRAMRGSNWAAEWFTQGAIRRI